MPHDPVKIEETRSWFTKARDDLRAASVDMDAEPTEIWTVDVGGSGAAYLAVGGSACYSPDGSRMVCTDHVAGSDAEIFVMNADGTNKTNITNSAAEDNSPHWGN